MSRALTALASLLLTTSAFANPAPTPVAGAPAGEPHPALALQPNAKMMLVKGPAHVGHIVSAGTGTAQVFEVATPNASNAGCIANPLPSSVPVTLANSTTQEVKREVPAGHLLCAMLTAGSAMSLTWYGHEQASGASGVMVTPGQPKMLVAGPITLSHTSTGGDAEITLYTMPSSSGTDADCLPTAAAGKPAPAPAAGALPAGGTMLKKLRRSASEKETLSIPSGRTACAMIASGSEGKVEWKTK